MSVILNNKRIANKLIQHQHGGASEAEIDRAFADDSVIPITWEERDDASLPGQNRREKWGYQNETWYDHLGIDNEYLVEKCKKKGINDPATHERIRMWGTKMYGEAYRRRNPQGDELYLTTAGKYVKDIPDKVKRALEEYSKVQKDAERASYQNCNLRYLDPERQAIHEAVQCQALNCDHRRTVSTPGELQDVLGDHTLSADKRAKYERCNELNELCRHPDNRFPFAFPRDAYHHISNSGIGDCLFVAVARYLNMAKELASKTGTGIAVHGIDGEYHFPDHQEIQDEQEHKVRICDEDKDLSMWLRLQAVDWLRKNPNFLITGSQITKYEIALTMLENNPTIISAVSFKKQLKEYFKEHNELGDLFQSGKHSDSVDTAKQLIQDEPPQQLAEALEHFVNFLNELYFEQMSDVTTYAGPQEVTALSQVLQVNILVVQNMGDQLVYNMGGIVPNTDRYIMVYHNTDVMGLSSYNHYEIMFPDAFLYPQVNVKAQKLSDADLSVMYSVVSYCGQSSSKKISQPKLIKAYRKCLDDTVVGSEEAVNILKMLLEDVCDKFGQLEHDAILEHTVKFIARQLPWVPESDKVNFIVDILAYISEFYSQEDGFAFPVLELLETAVKDAYMEILAVKKLFAETTDGEYFQVLLAKEVEPLIEGDELTFEEKAELWADTADAGRDDRQIMRCFIEDAMLPYITLSQVYYNQNNEEGTPEYAGLQLPLTAEALVKTYLNNYGFMDYNGDEQEQEQEQEEQQDQEQEVPIISEEYMELYDRLIHIVPGYVLRIDDDILDQITDAIETMGFTVEDVEDEMLNLITDQILEQ